MERRLTELKQSYVAEDVNIAEEKVNIVTASLTRVTDDLVAKKTKIEDLSSQAKFLVSAKSELISAEEQVTYLNETTDRLEALLPELKKEKQATQSYLSELRMEYAELLPKHQAAKQAYDQAMVNLAAAQALQATLEAKQIITTVPASKPANSILEKPVKTEVATVASTTKQRSGKSPSGEGRQLPKTGNRDSLVLVSLGVLLSVAGMAQLKREN